MTGPPKLIPQQLSPSFFSLPNGKLSGFTVLWITGMYYCVNSHFCHSGSWMSSVVANAGPIIADIPAATHLSHKRLKRRNCWIELNNLTEEGNLRQTLTTLTMFEADWQLQLVTELGLPVSNYTMMGGRHFTPYKVQLNVPDNRRQSIILRGRYGIAASANTENHIGKNKWWDLG